MKLSPNIWYITALIVAVALGFTAGKMTQDDPANSERNHTELTQNDNAKAQSSSRRSYDKAKARSSSRRSSSISNRDRSQDKKERDISLTMKTLLSRLERSPMASMDFDGMFEVWETMRDFSENDVLDALSSVEDIKTSQLRMTVQMMLMNRWGKINGEAAIEHALQAKNQQLKMTGTMGVFMSWTKENPEAAFDWYENNQEKLNSGGIYGGMYNGMIFQSLARHDLSRAMTQVEKMENGRQKKTALSSIGQAVVNNPAQLKKFLEFLDTDDNVPDKQEVMSTVISSMAMQDPDSAKALINNIDDPEQKKQLTASLMQSWSYMDPEAAIDWGMKQSNNDEDRKEIITSHLHTWASQNDDAAGQWYDKQPDHLKSDTAIESTATTLGYSQQYQKAFIWAERLQDADTLKKTKQTIYQSWHSSSPTAAEAWAEGKGKDTLEGIDLNTATEPLEQILPEHSLDE